MKWTKISNEDARTSLACTNQIHPRNLRNTAEDPHMQGINTQPVFTMGEKLVYVALPSGRSHL
jgi:hypothetical protein